jgi:hypothetical protein
MQALHLLLPKLAVTIPLLPILTPLVTVKPSIMLLGHVTTTWTRDSYST